MITIEPEPMNGPPSWRCQTGAGNLARSRSLPLIECCRKAASLTTTGARGCNVLRFSIQALSASSGRNFGSDAERERGPLRARGGIGENAKAARKAFDGVEEKRRGVGSSCRHLGDGADLETGICALDAPQRAKLVDKLDEFAQVLVHSVHSCRAARPR